MSKYRRFRCEWFKGEFNYETACGHKTKWQRDFHYCPFCGRTMIVINRSATEDDEENENE